MMTRLCCWLLSLPCIIFSAFFVQAQKTPARFTLLKPDETRVKFTNKVREDDSLHVLVYEYLYNGHGLGVGDFNADGLQDIFISGNTTPNKLFLNQGNLTFTDITATAGVAGNGTWSTGVSVADVNGDGLLDIYVCHSGKFPPARLVNELFINTGISNGRPAFREQAVHYGLDAPGTQSTQAAFFDYDRDGDLDMFLLNHSVNTYYAFLDTRKQRATPDPRYGNRLFRHDKRPDGTTVFTDVTLKTGIINNPLNYGLSVTISDINQDGWPDIYTTSDYSEHDCYYVNNRDGTFTQSLQRSFQHISKFSMGADVADFNNDGWSDVFTLDMLPADNHRQKLLKGPDEYDAYHLLLDSGYYRQNMRNMLQLNRGPDNANQMRFSEIGQLAGVSNTDWSWAGLFADLDNDGWKDLLVTNGYLRDFTDLDFLKYTMADAQLAAAAKGNINFKNYELVRKMPSNKLNNYLFHNKGDLTFTDVSREWGFVHPSISNAAAYADFDNDGDLDLIIGNNNEPVMFWRNNTSPASTSWIQVQVSSATENRNALGAKVRLYTNTGLQYQEVYPVRGFQSSVSPIVHFGLPANSRVDSLVVEWPSGAKRTVPSPAMNQLHRLGDEGAVAKVTSTPPRASVNAVFREAPTAEQIPFRHKENDFVDFKVEVLIPYQLSRLGPALATGDVNRDGNDDVFLGGAIGQPSQLYLQQANGAFIPAPQQPWQKDLNSEAVQALLFDADNDKDLDLYIVHGGNEYLDDSPEFQDKLYYNDGHGNFTQAVKSLPVMRGSKQAITAGDFDGDGDLDLFVGGRGKSGFFPLPSRSYILQNNSQPDKLAFTDVTDTVCPAVRMAGSVTAAVWADLTGDTFPELSLVGEWMPPLIFQNDNGKQLTPRPLAQAESLQGLWGALLATDVDGDGDKDLVLGNCGNNNTFKPSVKEPMTVHVADFDNNGTLDPIVCYYIQGKRYPMASRDELLDQIQPLKKKYIKYADYADATLETIFSKEQLSRAEVYTCTETNTLILNNDGHATFTTQTLPIEAQFSKTHSILTGDYNHDGISDLLLLGNFFGYRTQLGDCDASVGVFLQGLGKGTFRSVPPPESGLFADGDVRAAAHLRSAGGAQKLVIVRNNTFPQILNLSK
jgi:enediyne biosynthesis protein E4